MFVDDVLQGVSKLLIAADKCCIYQKHKAHVKVFWNEKLKQMCIDDIHCV